MVAPRNSGGIIHLQMCMSFGVVMDMCSTCVAVPYNTQQGTRHISHFTFEYQVFAMGNAYVLCKLCVHVVQAWSVITSFFVRCSCSHA